MIALADADLERYLQQAYLISKTFATLELYEPATISDTLLALTTTFLGSERGAVLLAKEGRLIVAAATGDRLATTLRRDAADFDDYVQRGVSKFISPQELGRVAPGVAEVSPKGLVVSALRAGDTALGLVIVDRVKAGLTGDADLAFLTLAAGIGSIALTNASAVVNARKLAATLGRESDEKSRIMQELDRQLQTIRMQQAAIQELSLPILQVWKGVIAAPVIGVVDADRGASINDRLLRAVAESDAQSVIVDVTGVAGVDSTVADEFVKVARSLRLLGVRVVMTGIQPDVAAALGASGLQQLSSVKTFSTLEKGLRYCMLESS
ncbi:MAG: STAS domain-containing protein [Myxococcales bacterium]|nr:STAS domain-containing protein [Myxococcales bacterium]